MILMCQAGVEVVHHLPGVGANLQDHLELYVAQQCSQPVTLYSVQVYTILYIYSAALYHASLQSWHWYSLL